MSDRKPPPKRVVRRQCKVHEAEIPKWAAVVKASGAKVD